MSGSRTIPETPKNSLATKIASDSSMGSDAADKTIPRLSIRDGQRHWVRVEVAQPDGKLRLIANPIFINWTESNPVI